MKHSFALKITKIINLLVELNYLIIIFIIPLYFSIVFPTYNVFELGKIFVFRSLVITLLTLTVARFLFDNSLAEKLFIIVKQIFLRKKKYYFIPLIFFVGLGISILFSGNITQSFFGSYTRQSGYLTYLFYFLLFILLVLNFIIGSIYKISADNILNNIRIKRILVAMVLSGTLVAFYGILQILGIDFLTWPEDPLITRRAFSSLGQVNFLASWLLLVIPITVYLVGDSKNNLSKFIFSLLSLAQLIGLLVTGSRGGIMALLVVIIIFIAYLVFFSKLKYFLKALIIISSCLLLLVGWISFNSISPGRLNDLLDFRSGSLAARLDFFKAAGVAFLEKPILGHGLDNGSQAFIKHYNTDWGIHSNIGVKNDRAHNLFLDIALAGGVLMLFLWSALYYYGARLVYENIRYKKNKLSLALGVGLMAYLISLLFSFSFVSGEIYFFLFLALLFFLNIKEACLVTSATEKITPPSRIYKSVIVGTFMLIFFLGSVMLFWEFKSLQADKYFFKLYYRLSIKDYSETFKIFDIMKKMPINPINKEYYLLFLGESLSEDYQEITDPLIRERALEELREVNQELTSNSFDNIFVKGKINIVLGSYSVAEKYLQTTAQISPYWPKSYIELARLFARSKRINESIIYYQLALKILPLVDDERFNEEHRNVLKNYQQLIFRELGDLYFSLGEYQLAEENYQQAFKANLKDFSLLKKIADSYYLRGELIKSLAYILRGAQLEPANYKWLLSAAILSKESGDNQRAHQYLEEALILSPQEDLLLQLKNEY